MIPIHRAPAFHQRFLVVTNHNVDRIHFVRGGVLELFHAHGATARLEFDQILRFQSRYISSLDMFSKPTVEKKNVIIEI